MTTRFTKEQLTTWADKLIEETYSDIEISRTDAHAESYRAQLALLEMARTALKDEPVVRPVMFIDGDISAADAEKLATIIREWDNEPVADVVAWYKEGEERACDIRWRRFDVAPGPLFTAPPATANEARQNRDLVMMVKVLARTVRKYNAGSQQAKDFLAYLERECLVSSTDCLRIDAKDPG